MTRAELLVQLLALAVVVALVFLTIWVLVGQIGSSAVGVPTKAGAGLSSRPAPAAFEGVV